MSALGIEVSPARRERLSLLALADACGLPWVPTAAERPEARIGRHLHAGRCSAPTGGAEAGIVIAGADWWARPIAGRLVPALVLHIGTGPSLLSESDAQLMRRTLDHGFAVVLSLARAADVEVLIADLVAANREC